MCVCNLLEDDIEHAERAPDGEVVDEAEEEEDSVERHDDLARLRLGLRLGLRRGLRLRLRLRPRVGMSLRETDELACEASSCSQS